MLLLLNTALQVHFATSTIISLEIVSAPSFSTRARRCSRESFDFDKPPYFVWTDPMALQFVFKISLTCA